MERLFYSDSQIEQYEKAIELSKVICYLEEEYSHTKNKETLLSLISFSWFYMVEGDVNQEPIDYDWEFFKFKLIKYINLARKLYNDEERVCYVIGYILSTNWEYLGPDYEVLGKDYMKKCFLISEDKNIKFLAASFLGKSFKVSEEFVHNLRDNLFPSNCFVDSYFREIINNINLNTY